MTLAVDREQPLTALNVAARWPPLALCYLRVHFVNETAVDEGGVFRDFMSLIGECVTNELLIGSGKKGDADDGDVLDGRQRNACALASPPPRPF